jgi:ApbE superfamily uncharacterized protein (UPF0280 family)
MFYGFAVIINIRGHSMSEKLLISESWSFKETEVLIKADDCDAIEAAKKSIISNRNDLERYIARNPIFKLSLDPIDVEAGSPKVVQLMADAARGTGVGPMAAVAGTLAQVAVEDAVASGTRNILVDNGGDIFIHGDRRYAVAIHAGKSPLSNKLALEVDKEMLPISVCTSSATVGPSLSFGEADAVTIVASSGALADAAATAVCNETRGEPEQAIKAGLERARKIPRLTAALIIHGRYVGTWGNFPRLVLADKLGEELMKRIQIRI